MKQTLTKFAIVLIIALLADTVWAAKFTIKASIHTAEDYYTDSAYPSIMAFKQLVESGSKGDIKVDIYPNEQLGNQQEIIEGIQLGTIQMALTSSTTTSTVVPEIGALIVPFMFNNYYEAWTFYDSDFVKTFMEAARKRGLHYLGQVDDGGGFVCLTNNKRLVKSPADLVDIKMRDLDHPGRLAFWKALGVTATPIPWGELYLALQTGVVDGQSNAIGVVSWAKFWEVQKYVTELKHYYSALYWMMSEKFYQKLPPEYQKLVEQSMKEAQWAGRGIALTSTMVAFDKAEEEGMEIYHPSGDEINEFRKIGQPAFIKWLNTTIDPKLTKSVLDEVERIRNQ